MKAEHCVLCRYW